MIDGLRRDFGHALRMLRRRPGFAAVILLTLALGIGANTVVFSVVRSVLLRPLPFPEDARLAVVFIRAPDFDVEDFPSSAPEYIEYRDHTRSWEQLAAWYASAATVTGDGGEPERVGAAFVAWNLFTTLGIEPLLGRTFTAEENEEGSAAFARSSRFTADRPDQRGRHRAGVHNASDCGHRQSRSALGSCAARGTCRSPRHVA